MKNLILTLIVLLFAPALAHADSLTQLATRPPVIVVSMDTHNVLQQSCTLTLLDKAGQPHPLDPAKLGEAERKAGRYPENPYAPFAGHGYVFNGATISQCTTIAGHTAQVYGIPRVAVYLNGKAAMVSVPEGFRWDGSTPRPFSEEMVVYSSYGARMMRSGVEFMALPL